MYYPPAQLKLNSKGSDVAKLHKALQALGYLIAAKEKKQNQFGTTTLAATVKFQLSVDLPGSGVVDVLTTEKLEIAFRGNRERTGINTYLVAGYVYSAMQQTLENMTVIAMEVNLLGAAIFDTAETLAVLDNSSGFEKLGETTTDAAGYYAIHFDAIKYRQMESDFADIVVYATVADKIVGRTSLTLTSGFGGKKELENLDITVSNPQVKGLSEYAILLRTVTPIVEKSKISLFQLDGSLKQLQFLATQTGQSLQNLTLLVQADKLRKDNVRYKLNTELLYATGRQLNNNLNLQSIALLPDIQISQHINSAVSKNIIQVFSEDVIDAFIKSLHTLSVSNTATDAGTAPNSNNIGNFLKIAINDPVLQTAFLSIYKNYTGAPEEFWTTYLPEQPAFSKRPDLVQSLMLTNTLSTLTGNNLALVGLLKDQVVSDVTSLISWTNVKWVSAINKAGVMPLPVAGLTETQQVTAYAQAMQTSLFTAYPTKKITAMISGGEIKPDDNADFGDIINRFISDTPAFDFSISKITDFTSDINNKIPAAYRVQATQELQLLQRLYQVSPSPQALSTLYQNGFTSAFQIASVPAKIFGDTYSPTLGAEAIAVHDRATFMVRRSEATAMKMIEYTRLANPEAVLGAVERATVNTFLSGNPAFADYANLFGTPDMCECMDCLSVYSPAAYFVDLLRFLQQSKSPTDNISVYDALIARRPDLPKLELTCENTYTTIPYIDIVNEIMESYVVNASITAYDTGDATPDELSAEPQNTLQTAYYTLSQACFPFSLPYHQPLDVIRTYLGNIQTSRAQVMRIFGQDGQPATATALLAELLRLSPEQYQILTGVDFSGAAPSSPTDTAVYYGYTFGTAYEADLAKVTVFLNKTGILYTDLVALLLTQFINPGLNTLIVLQTLFSGNKDITNNVLYTELNNGTWTADSNITAMLGAQNPPIDIASFQSFITAQIESFNKLVTLYEADSACDLNETNLMTVSDIYTNPLNNTITDDTFSRLHKFIRLWRVTGYTIQQLDILIKALGDTDITAVSIAKLSVAQQVNAVLKIPVQRLSCIWGDIDTFGSSSTYAALFLSKTQNIDPLFRPNVFGVYFSVTDAIANHTPAILSAYKITGNDLALIIADAGVTLTTEIGIANLSHIYRYTVLSGAMGLSVADFITLKQLFAAAPFNSPADTLILIKQAAKLSDSGFLLPQLNYIINNVVAPTATFALNSVMVMTQLAATISAITQVDQDHTESVISNPSEASLRKDMSLIFTQSVTEQLIGMLKDTVIYQVRLLGPYPPAIAVINTSGFIEKLAYDTLTGLLICTGVLQDDEKNAWAGAYSGYPSFMTALNSIYSQPEIFISANFLGLFSADFTAANQNLLNHPAAVTVLTTLQKYQWFYTYFLPFLKNQLKQDAVVSNVAQATGLDDQTAGLITAADLPELLTLISSAGLDAAYFNSTNDSGAALFTKTDTAFSFDWTENAPANTDNSLSITSNPFAVDWHGWILPAVTDDYTFIIDLFNCTAFNLIINEVQLLTGSPALIQSVPPIRLIAGSTYEISIKAEFNLNSSFVLSWQTSTMSKQVVPANVLYPFTEAIGFSGLLTNYYRAALLCAGFDLSPDEISYFSQFAADFDNINFNFNTAAPNIIQWGRLADYTALRNSLPLQAATLIQVFRKANLPSTLSNPADFYTLVAKTADWDPKAFQLFIATPPFNYAVADFKNEVALIKLKNAFNLANTCGLDVTLFSAWAQPDTDFNTLYQKSLDIKNAVKSKYADADWPAVATQLSNIIREDQKQALISYLLVLPAANFPGVTILDADSLFEFFLIDVQMDACMDTSRMVQVIAAAQLFVTRCLMALEKGINPAAIATDQWAWMQNYSVWGAARQVFLYPENYLLEINRDDKSPLFETFESNLLQSDINVPAAESAYRTYLDGLSEIANLEVCGMYQDSVTTAGSNVIHVFARTHAAPYRYYYRYYDNNKNWWTWEKVPLDIRSTDDKDSSSSGVHLIPVVWQGRLFLFWPEFIMKQDQSQTPSDTFVNLSKDNTPDQLASTPYFEIRLCWSEYKNKAWTPKQQSKEFLTHHGIVIALQEQLKYYQFKTRFTTSTVNSAMVTTLNIDVILKVTATGVLGTFSTDNIQMPFQVSSNLLLLPHNPDSTAFFMASSRTDSLTVNNNSYFQKSLSYQLLSSIDDVDGNTFNKPFFFSDQKKTYFVTPQAGIFGFGSSPLPSFPGIRQIPGVDVPGITIGNTVIYRSFSNTRALGNSVSAVIDKTSAGNIFSTQYQIPQAFGGSYVNPSPPNPNGFGIGIIVKPFPYTSLQFTTFFHPMVTDLSTALNTSGLDGFFNFTAAQPLDGKDGGAQFKYDYDPIVGPFDVLSPLPAINIDLSLNGPYSVYNWEMLFHGPLLIATTLSGNGQYADAMAWFNYIFNPTTNAAPDPTNPDSTARYWNFVPFKTDPVTDITTFLDSLAPNVPNATVTAWRDSCFNPFAIARAGRPVAFMKNVVMKYLDNLIAWGDSLYMQQTRESVNQATQLYVMAVHILGPQPQAVPARGTIAAATFSSLSGSLDAFSNALVQLENIFPYSNPINAPVTPYTGNNLLGVGQTLYFCIPDNNQLLQYWSTVSGRLFNIRHCKNIQGLDLVLALFEPIINPALLVQAAAQGVSIGSVLSDLDSPAPLYRFSYLMQKATEFCSEVKALGSALLSALEKRDGEELGRLRASHESNLLDMITEVKNRQVLEAQAAIDGLTKSRENTVYRLQHYNDELLGNPDISIPDSPDLSPDLDASTALPADTVITDVGCTVNVSILTDTGVLVIPAEENELQNLAASNTSLINANIAEMLAGGLRLIPQINVELEPLGVGAETGFGGVQLGAIAEFAAKALHSQSSIAAYAANVSSKMASYIRREQEWVFQSNLAIREIVQLDKQIVAAEIRLQIAQQELKNHLQQIANAQDINTFLHGGSVPGYNVKFSTTELYIWMKNQLFNIYQQSYQMAYTLAKKAEKAYQFELGIQNSEFIQYGYWNSSYQGLVSGEQLHLALKQMEQNFIEENVREFELTKHISLNLIAPDQLYKLIQTGTCQITLPEELFDFDFPGHYFRRIKSVSITIPCIAGPYTTINASLHLLQNNIRINSQLLNGRDYVQSNVNGIPANDARFIQNVTPFTAIATSSAQTDSGTFELNFRDERYLPFEGAGVISQWQLQINGRYINSKTNLLQDISQFDYDTISDVILHFRYTAREDETAAFKDSVYNHVSSYIGAGPFQRLFSLKSDFPEAFYQLFNAPNGIQATQIKLTNDNFPLLFANREISILAMKAYLLPASATVPITTGSLTVFGQTSVITLENLYKTTGGSGTLQALFDLTSPIKLSALTPTIQSTELVQSQIDDIMLLIDYSSIV